jgi:Ca2+-binding EF-hand superfamily protein
MQAWKLLGQGGTEHDAMLAFKRTDIDDSGYIDWNEFIFSILGDDAGDYGLVADLDTMGKMVDEVSGGKLTFVLGF